MSATWDEVAKRDASYARWKVVCCFFIVALFLVLLRMGVGVAAAQSIVRVPQNQPTIQAAINAAQNGDTVIVAPGTYFESINFNGKAITIRSEGGPNVTVIDAGGTNSVVTFTNGEGISSKLIGFTIQNGGGSRFDEGGGVYIAGASPTVMDNIITKNRACIGVGIAIFGGSPVIQRNVITGSIENGCGGGLGGGGIYMGAGAPQILGNVIAGNTRMFSSGGGIDINGSDALIQGNIISGNVANNTGGGISMRNLSNALFVQNLIVGNSASQGGGVYWSIPGFAPKMVNNTIADNDGQPGAGVFVGGDKALAELINNVIVAKPGQTALHCEFSNSGIPSTPIIQFNNIYTPSGAAYGGVCNNATGTAGNISAAPAFVDQTRENYRLNANSPGIDAGSNTAVGLPTRDIEGNARVRDGDGNGVAIVDVGAYEFTSTPPTLTVSSTAYDLGTLYVGSASVSRTVTISNTASVPVAVAYSAVASNDPASFSLATGGPVPCASLSPTLAPGTNCTLVLTLTPNVPNPIFAPNALSAKNARVVVMSDAIGSPATAAFKATVLVPDSAPDFFSFLPQTGVARSSIAVSNSATVSGINLPTAISVAGGEYSINGSTFTSNPGTVLNGQSVVVRLTSSSDYGVTRSATLTIGSLSSLFYVTTQPFDGTQYFPLSPGYSWMTSSNGTPYSTSTVSTSQVVNGVSTTGVSESVDGSVSYYTNDSDGVRLHRIFSPGTSIPGCGTVAETDTLNTPMRILPASGSIGQAVDTSGILIADAGVCGNFSVGYFSNATPQAIERVTVPAGRFEALKVQLSIQIAGSSTATTLWFAPGIGQIKQMDGDGTVYELASTNIVRTTPDDIVFLPQSNVAPNSVVISNAVTIGGTTAPATVSISGGEYSINGSAFTSQSGTVTNGQHIQVRVLSPAAGNASASATLTVGGVTGTFAVVTGVGVPAPPIIVAATAGIGSINVTFAAPGNSGGSSISGYVATCVSSDGGAPGSNSGGANATSIRVSGLTNGRRYTCTVAANNAVGTGVASAASSLISPIDITPILNLLLMDDD